MRQCGGWDIDGLAEEEGCASGSGIQERFPGEEPLFLYGGRSRGRDDAVDPVQESLRELVQGVYREKPAGEFYS